MEKRTGDNTFNSFDPLLGLLFDSIINEMNVAAKKHPVWSTDPIHRAAIVSEEAGEVLREANHFYEGKGDVLKLRQELIQTAGTCLRFLILLDQEANG